MNNIDKVDFYGLSIPTIKIHKDSPNTYNLPYVHKREITERGAFPYRHGRYKT